MSTPPATTVTHRDLPGDVTATIVTVRDLEGVEVAAQITTPDEPLNGATLLALADSLRDLARDVMRERTA